jgi:hypothetical protein
MYRATLQRMQAGTDVYAVDEPAYLPRTILIAPHNHPLLPGSPQDPVVVTHARAASTVIPNAWARVGSMFSAGCAYHSRRRLR